MIQIDVKMPKNCAECPCLHHGEYGAFEKSWCAINPVINIRRKGRPKDCPLKNFESVEILHEKRAELKITNVRKEEQE